MVRKRIAGILLTLRRAPGKNLGVAGKRNEVRSRGFDRCVVVSERDSTLREASYVRHELCGFLSIGNARRFRENGIGSVKDFLPARAVDRDEDYMHRLAPAGTAFDLERRSARTASTHELRASNDASYEQRSEPSSFDHAGILGATCGERAESTCHSGDFTPRRIAVRAAA